MTNASKEGASDGVQRQRWAFHYRVDGDIRFLSHRDMIRMFERAIARAALPVKYTEGFNPHARISIPLPRPVGVASRDEAVVAEFEQPIDGADAAIRLGGTTPSGVDVISARRLAPGESLKPTQARYRLELTETPDQPMLSRINEVLTATTIKVARRDLKGNGVRSVEIRPSLLGLEVNGNTLEFAIQTMTNGTAKPSEIAALLGFDPRSINHRICRTEIQWQ
jgi:radical SAM-linked protein